MMAKLGDVFELQITGEWGSECTENGTGTKVLRTTNFTPEGRINYDDVVVRSINKSKVEKKRLRCGDIILEKSGGTEKTPVGRVVFCDESIDDSIYLCNNFTQAMRVNQTIAIPKYVFYFMWNLHCSGRTDLLQNKTTGIRNLQVKLYLNEECLLPTLDEQRKIAAVLDNVSNLISKNRQQLNKLDELVKSRFIEMFGNPVLNTKNWYSCAISEKSNCMVPGRDKPKSFTGDIPWITIDDLIVNGVTYKSKKGLGLTTGEIKDVKRSTIPAGSIIMSCVGNLGVCSIAGIPMVINQQLHSFQCNNELNNIFAMRYLEYRKDYMNSRATNTTVLYMNKAVCSSIPIIVPPIELQNEFAEFVQQVDKSKLAVQKSLDELETLKKALMQEYFG